MSMTALDGPELGIPWNPALGASPGLSIPSGLVSLCTEQQKEAINASIVVSFAWNIKRWKHSTTHMKQKHTNACGALGYYTSHITPGSFQSRSPNTAPHHILIEISIYENHDWESHCIKLHDHTHIQLRNIWFNMLYWYSSPINYYLISFNQHLPFTAHMLHTY